MLSVRCVSTLCLFFFFFNDTATTEIYTLSLHDALPISQFAQGREDVTKARSLSTDDNERALVTSDRKSTRLNSSHPSISYAVFCLKKKNSHQRSHYSSHSRRG